MMSEGLLFADPSAPAARPSPSPSLPEPFLDTFLIDFIVRNSIDQSIPHLIHVKRKSIVLHFDRF